MSKSSQRAADADWVAKGLDIEAMEGEQLAALMRVVHERVQVGLQRRSVAPFMHFLYENFSRTAGNSLGGVAIACGAGCSHCCNIWVDASAPEVLYVAKGLTGARRRKAIADVAAAMVVTDGKTFDERGEMVTPCPMLQGDMCSIYPARPITCRSAVSADAAICKRSYFELTGENIPTPAPFMIARGGYALALSGALKRAGLSTGAYEFNSALRIALETDDAERRWMDGEDIFAAAQRAEMFDIMTLPQNAMIYHAAFNE